MNKRIAALLFLAMAITMFSGCGNENTAVSVIGGTDGPTDTEDATQVEAWEYELYVEDIDYYMDKYLAAYYPVREALAYQDIASAKEHIDSEIEALGKLEKTVCPPGLEDIHSKFIYVVGLAKEYEECYRDYLGYIENGDSLSPEVDALVAELDAINKKIDESGNISTVWFNAQSAAFAHLPNGEYRSYSARLEYSWNHYVWCGDLIAGVFFDGVSGDLLSLSNGCLSALSSIENMDLPEQLKPYHNDISEAIPMERDFCQAIVDITETYREYPELKPEDMPADAQNKIQECQKTIDAYYSEDNSEWDALYNAVCAALEFADAQAGQ
ncbi:MAG: hypothetical protein IJZ95_02465 [Oscillospiraceae bacterium]|nr:hypothetical protein [Oscillospiraceae bacterium]